jgi:hypothetical protein
MPKKKYIVSLTLEERLALEKLTTTGIAAAYKINHARVLLKADINQDSGGWTDTEISNALDVSIATIERVRHRFVEVSEDTLPSTDNPKLNANRVD